MARKNTGLLSSTFILQIPNHLIYKTEFWWQPQFVRLSPYLIARHVPVLHTTIHGTNKSPNPATPVLCLLRYARLQAGRGIKTYKQPICLLVLMPHISNVQQRNTGSRGEIFEKAGCMKVNVDLTEKVHRETLQDQGHREPMFQSPDITKLRLRPPTHPLCFNWQHCSWKQLLYNIRFCYSPPPQPFSEMWHPLPLPASLNNIEFVSFFSLCCHQLCIPLLQGVFIHASAQGHNIMLANKVNRDVKHLYFSGVRNF